MFSLISGCELFVNLVPYSWFTSSKCDGGIGFSDVVFKFYDSA